MYEISNPTPNLRRLLCKINGKLEDLLEWEGLSPADGVAVLANNNLLGRVNKARIFKRIDYNKNADASNAQILGEAQKRVKNGKVEIDKPVRAFVGPYLLQYNFLRGFRPTRAARLENIDLDQPFDPTKFHYLPPGAWVGAFDTVRHDDLLVELTLNLYPFAPYHFLWLPDVKYEKEPLKKHNQYFDPKEDRYLIEAAWDFVKEHGENVWLCYNSLGAHASVNHMHLQGFVTTDDWEPPFAKILREHEEGPAIWSWIPGARYIPASNAVDGLCDFISEMNDRWKAKKDNAYHFCMNSKGIVCFPRKRQGDKEYFSMLEKAPFTTGFAFFEALGEIICPIKEISVFETPIIEKKIADIYQVMELKGC